MSLSESYKIETAKSFTELAIQNGLITTYANAEDTANEICKLFKTIKKNLDD